MTHKSSVEKAREQAHAQMTKAEQHKREAELKKQESIRIQAEQLAAEKEEKRAERKRKMEKLAKTLSDLKDKHLKERLQSDLIYAENESLRVSIGLSAVIALVIYLLIF